MTFQNEIDLTHPMNDFASHKDAAAAMAADGLAMKLVGERHSKRDLVDLVRCLILAAGWENGPTADTKNHPLEGAQ